MADQQLLCRGDRATAPREGTESHECPGCRIVNALCDWLSPGHRTEAPSTGRLVTPILASPSQRPLFKSLPCELPIHLPQHCKVILFYYSCIWLVIGPRFSLCFCQPWSLGSASRPHSQPRFVRPLTRRRSRRCRARLFWRSIAALLIGMLRSFYLPTPAKLQTLSPMS